MCNFFDHILHHYWTPQRWQNNWHLQSLIPTAWNKKPFIISWTHMLRESASRRSNYIKLSKQGNSSTKASGSLGVKFSKIFPIWWGNSTQWISFLPNGGILVHMGIGGHPPIPLAQNSFPFWQFSCNFLWFSRSQNFGVVLTPKRCFLVIRGAIDTNGMH